MRKKMVLFTGAILSLGISMNYGCQFGVTPGGSQDIGLARDLIANGQIPLIEHFTVEGVFSEHDLPFREQSCGQTLCPRYGVAMYSPLESDDQELLVQVGFTTNISAENFQRRPLNLSLVVDISASMEGEKLALMKQALLTLSNQLKPWDRVSLVSFNSNAELQMEAQYMNDGNLTKLRNKILNLNARSGTNIEMGMKIGYADLYRQAELDETENRLMLFTDANPNIGNTSTGSFLNLARTYGYSGIGLSIFGVGLDLGSKLASEVSKTRGGNSFYLGDEESIAQILDDEFDYIVSPIGYDFEVNVQLTPEVALSEIYGSTHDAGMDGFSFGASTLFLSKRNGGLGVTLQGVELPIEQLDPKFVSIDLRYKTLDLEPHEELIYVQRNNMDLYENEFVHADSLGVFKMAHLIYEYEALKAAAEFCEHTRSEEEAIRVVELAKERIGTAAEQLNDDNLAEEQFLMEQLIDNIYKGKAACAEDPYDPFLYY